MGLAGFPLTRAGTINLRALTLGLVIVFAAFLGGSADSKRIATSGKSRTQSPQETKSGVSERRLAAATTGTLRSPAAPHFTPSFGQWPLNFEVNQGQTDGRVKFLSRGALYTLFLTSDEAVLTLQKPGGESKIESREREYQEYVAGRSLLQGAGFPAFFGLPAADPRSGPALQGQSRSPSAEPAASAVLRMRLMAANPHPRVSGMDELPGKSNYFIGNDPAQWHTNVPNYAKVRYENVYPGVDLVYYGKQRQLEYDFVVAPGTDPNVIRLALASEPSPQGRGWSRHAGPGEGSRMQIDANGDLLIAADSGEVRFHKPVVYQPAVAPVSSPAFLSLVAGHSSTVTALRIPIEAHYALDAQNRVRFQVAPYDHSKPLVIDPTLTYSTYLGGAGTGDQGNAIAVDSGGDAYVTGFTGSASFPITPGAFQTTGVPVVGSTDAFVTKFNPSGSALIYSTYLGGTPAFVGAPATSIATAVALDSGGNAYVTGWTNELDFPTTPGSYEVLYPGGYTVTFVTKLNPTGSALVYSTYLGGGGLGASGQNQGNGIAVDSAGNAHVSGFTGSSGFPTTPGAYQTTNKSTGSFIYDAFVTKFNPTGASLVYSTYLGGSGDDFANGIALDQTGTAYVTGRTTSSDFPTTPGALGTTIGCGLSAPCTFVTKLNVTGTGLDYSGLLSFEDSGNGIAVDSAGNAYVAGSGSKDCSSGAFSGPVRSVAIAKLNAAGSALVYSLILSGVFDDSATSIVVDSAGNAYVAGGTGSPDFPTTPGAFQSTVDGACEGGFGSVAAFITKINAAGSALIFSTLFGGVQGNSQGTGIAVDSTGNAYVTGSTNSSSFQTTSGAFQTALAGALQNAFVTKFSGLVLPVATFSPASLTFPSQVFGTTSAPQTITLTNNGDASMTITSIAASGDFAETNTCPAASGTLAPGASCTITVTFTPTAAGTRTGAISVNDSAPGSPHTMNLTGTGVSAAAVVLSSANLSFGNQLVGSTSAPQTVKLSNTGTGPLDISSISTSLANFVETNNCPNALAAGANCSINVSFAPTVTGSVVGSLNINDDGPGNPHVVVLTGTGTQPTVTLSPSSTDFPARIVGTTSAAQTVTLTNSGTATLTITSIAAGGDFGESHTCGGSLAAGASCTISATFTPRAGGQRSGTITITDNAPGSPQSVTLSGGGEDFSVAPASGSPTSAAVVPGQTVTFTLVLAPVGGFSQSVLLSCNGAPPSATCTVPSSITLNGSGAESAIVSLSTTAASRLVPRPHSSPPVLGRQRGLPLLLWVLVLAMLAALATAGRRRARWGLAVSMALVLLWAACGGGGAGGGVGIPGTPLGSYSLTVTATFSSASTTLKHAVTLNLTVQ